MSDANLASLLLADAPHPSRAADLHAFAHFIGSWDMTVRFFDVDGGCVFDGVGLWQFGWILDGRAIQDVLHYGALADLELTGDRQLGSSLRFCDPNTKIWTVTWLGAVSGTYIHLQGQPCDDGRIVLRGEDTDGSDIRWTFSDITADSFTWTGETRPTSTHPWRVEQLMTGRRR